MSGMDRLTDEALALIIDQLSRGNHRASLSRTQSAPPANSSPTAAPRRLPPPRRSPLHGQKPIIKAKLSVLA